MSEYHMSLITFPPEFVATKYPGYFWNLQDRRLYSIKVSGELSPLTRTEKSYWNNFSYSGYRVSVKGRRRVLTDEYLDELKPSNSTVPVKQ